MSKCIKLQAEVQWEQHVLQTCGEGLSTWKVTQELFFLIRTEVHFLALVLLLSGKALEQACK